MDIEVNFLFRPEVTNYYHFIHDFCAPLYHKLKEMNALHQRHTLSITKNPRQIERYLYAFQLLFPNITYLIDGCGNVDKRFDFDYCSERKQVIDFKHHVFSKVKTTDNNNKYLLLIEREMSTINNKAITKIRMLENHEQLEDKLKRYCMTKRLIFKNVKLREIPFPEQVNLFRNSKIVVGQHGAGLLNLLWMSPDDSNLIEIGHDFWNGKKCIHRVMFKILAKMNKINYIYTEPIINNIANVEDILNKVRGTV